MSLIQEALKRQQQESGEPAAADTKPPVQQPSNTTLSLRKAAVAPPPIPAEQVPSPTGQPIGIPLENVTGDKKKKSMQLIILAVILLVAVGAGAWSFFKLKKGKPAPAKTATAQAQKPSVSAPVQAAVTDELVKPPAVAVVTPPEAVAPVQPQAPMIQPPEPEKPVPPPVAVKPPPPEEVPVVWPTLTVNGIFEGKGANRSSAIINKQIISVGETIEDVKLIAVRNQGVELEYKGKRQFVKNRSSTQ